VSCDTRGVLRHQVELAHAACGQLLHLVDDRFLGTALNRTAQFRDNAERAFVGASFGNFDIGGIKGRGQNAIAGRVKILRRLVRVVALFGTVGAVQKMLQQGILFGAEQVIDFRDLLQEFFGMAFRQASGNDQSLASTVRFVSGHFQNGIDRFLDRRLQKPAGVDDNDIRFRLVRRHLVARHPQVSE
jgi:hypothetical protein